MGVTVLLLGFLLTFAGPSGSSRAQPSSSTSSSQRTGVLVRSTPASADVYVDRHRVGQTPIELTEALPQQSVELRVRAEDFQDFVMRLGPEQLRSGMTIAAILIPLPSPTPCTGPAASVWRHLLPSAQLSAEVATQLKRCLVDAKDWVTLELVLTRQLEDSPSGPLYYDRARASFFRGGTDHYMACMQDARRAQEHSDLDRCTRWRAQYTELLCLENCEQRSRRADTRCQAPRGVKELKATLLHSLENEEIERSGSSSERLCFYEIRRALEQVERP